MLYSNAKKPAPQYEKVSKKELAVLDKVSITSVVDFMRKFQSDATFAPPSVGVSFDSDNFDVSIDDEGEVPSIFDNLEEYDPIELRDAMNSKQRDAKK